jgi:hypothetical protein
MKERITKENIKEEDKLTISKRLSTVRIESDQPVPIQARKKLVSCDTNRVKESMAFKGTNRPNETTTDVTGSDLIEIIRKNNKLL